MYIIIVHSKRSEVLWNNIRLKSHNDFQVEYEKQEEDYEDGELINNKNHIMKKNHLYHYDSSFFDIKMSQITIEIITIRFKNNLLRKR